MKKNILILILLSVISSSIFSIEKELIINLNFIEIQTGLELLKNNNKIIFSVNDGNVDNFGEYYSLNPIIKVSNPIYTDTMFKETLIYSIDIENNIYSFEFKRKKFPFNEEQGNFRILETKGNDVALGQANIQIFTDFNRKNIARLIEADVYPQDQSIINYNIRLYESKTPLIVSIINKNKVFLEYLLQNSKYTDIDYFGKDAIYYAKEYNYIDIDKMLYSAILEGVKQKELYYVDNTLRTSVLHLSDKMFIPEKLEFLSANNKKYSIIKSNFTPDGYLNYVKLDGQSKLSVYAKTKKDTNVYSDYYLTKILGRIKKDSIMQILDTANINGIEYARISDFDNEFISGFISVHDLDFGLDKIDYYIEDNKLFRTVGTEKQQLFAEIYKIANSLNYTILEQNENASIIDKDGMYIFDQDGIFIQYFPIGIVSESLGTFISPNNKIIASDHGTHTVRSMSFYSFDNGGYITSITYTGNIYWLDDFNVIYTSLSKNYKNSNSGDDSFHSVTVLNLKTNIKTYIFESDYSTFEFDIEKYQNNSILIKKTSVQDENDWTDSDITEEMIEWKSDQYSNITSF